MRLPWNSHDLFFLSIFFFTVCFLAFQQVAFTNPSHASCTARNNSRASIFVRENISRRKTLRFFFKPYIAAGSMEETRSHFRSPPEIPIGFIDDESTDSRSNSCSSRQRQTINNYPPNPQFPSGNFFSRVGEDFELNP